MDTKKITIIALVVLGVIYIGGVTTNLTKSKDSNDQNADSFDMEKNKWVGVMQNLFSGFNDTLDKNRIQPTNCKILNNNKSSPKTGTQNYRLSIASECKISLAKQKKADMQELIITVNNNVTVLRPCGKNEKPSNRRSKAKFDTTLFAMNYQTAFVNKPKRNARTRKRTNIKTNRPSNKTLTVTLAIKYTPNDSDTSSGAAICRAKLPYKIPIFEAGGRLILKCKGCTTKKTVNVSFGKTDT